MHACCGSDDVTDERPLALFIDEFESRHAEIMLCSEADGLWLRIRGEGRRLGMGAQELRHRPGSDVLEELQEFFTGTSREARNGMGYDVCVFASSELETDRHAAGIGVGVEVGDLGDAGGVGETDPDGRTGIVEVWCCRELPCFESRYERAIEEFAFGMGWDVLSVMCWLGVESMRCTNLCGSLGVVRILLESLPRSL